MATRIDTLRTYETIAAAGVEDKAARAISNAIADASNDWRADLATKSDIGVLKTDIAALRTEIEAVKTGTQTTMEALRSGTKADLETQRLATKTDFDQFRTSSAKDLEAMALRLENLITTKQNSSLIWTFGMLVAFTAIMSSITAAIIKLL